MTFRFPHVTLEHGRVVIFGEPLTPADASDLAAAVRAAIELGPVGRRVRRLSSGWSVRREIRDITVVMPNGSPLRGGCEWAEAFAGAVEDVGGVRKQSTKKENE